ncbi:MAG: restriction endonuclease subunit S [Synechococcales cyanobacterium]
MRVTKKLREVISFKGGGTPSKKIANYWDGDIPWATVKDFASTSLLTTQDYITHEGLENSAANLIPKGHVIIPTRMSLGKAAINVIDLAINQDLRALIPKVELDTEYLLYAVLSLKDQIIKKGSGATVKGITQEALYDLEIFFPPLDDQKCIAYLLGKVEGLIAQRKQHLQQLDDLLKSAFLEMFGDPGEMESQDHFLLGDFIEFLTSGSRGWANYYAESGSVFLRINNVKDGRLKLDDMVYVNAPDSAEAIRTRVREGDLLFSITADLGRTAVVSKELEGSYINQHLALIRLKSNEELAPLYLAWYFTMPYGRSFIQKKNREGVKAGLNFDDLRGLKFIKPSINLQNKFATIVKKIEDIKSNYQASLTDLETLYGALSQKAFKGELDLSRIPLPPHDTQAAATLKTNVRPQSKDDSFELPAPSELATLNSVEGRNALVDQWLRA